VACGEAVAEAVDNGQVGGGVGARGVWKWDGSGCSGGGDFRAAGCVLTARQSEGCGKRRNGDEAETG
jgi:hypothetical protein